MTDLEQLRERIAAYDRQIMELLSNRLNCAIEVGRYKAEHGLQAHNPEVERKVISRYRTLAEELGMDPDRAEEICKIIMQESISNEEAIIGREQK